MTLEAMALTYEAERIKRLIDRLTDAVEILALELPPTRMMDVMAILDEVRGE